MPEEHSAENNDSFTDIWDNLKQIFLERIEFLENKDISTNKTGVRNGD